MASSKTKTERNFVDNSTFVDSPLSQVSAAELFRDTRQILGPSGV